MEHSRFDSLTRLIGRARTRRDTLRIATAALLVGVTSMDSATAKRRGRKRRKVHAADLPPCTNVCRNCTGKPVGPGANLARCDFTGADFTEGVNLSAANISNTCFVNAELPSALFRGANAVGACFQDTNLIDASFRGASLVKANFCGAVLYGADFRGSNVTAKQLECAAFIGCNTILPNGKPAVTCAANETCCLGECVNTNTDPFNCGACEVECGLCQTCQSGRCAAAPNNTVSCDGSPLVAVGEGVKCADPAAKGICQDGQCNCGFEIGVYDPESRLCRCTDDEIAECASDGGQCCILEILCTDGAEAKCGNCPAR